MQQSAPIGLLGTIIAQKKFRTPLTLFDVSPTVPKFQCPVALYEKKNWSTDYCKVYHNFDAVGGTSNNVEGVRIFFSVV